eukprot:TRINITY_DN28137_c0_g1_i1.p1 TRINITY_DN28137_c0_g1~~TRINITY_DN28137_c0_g1_i1.p1  ORF type:complete len:686 (+),score=171.99 TRINITY_DN28137_c0_g1_i1:130-2187(+)
MRRSNVVCRKWQSLTKYPGNAIRALKEGKLFRQLRADDMHRYTTGQPIWLKTTRRAVDDLKEEHGLPEHVKPDLDRVKAVRTYRSAPVDLQGLEVTGLDATVCRMLLRQGIKELTPVQTEMMQGLRKRTDLVITSYTGSGKTFGLVLAVADRMLGQSGDLPFSFLIVLPTQPLCLQFQKWLSLFVGDAPAQHVVIGEHDTEEDVQEVITTARPLCVIGTPAGFWKTVDYKKAKRKELWAQYGGGWHDHVPGAGFAFDLIRMQSQLVVVDEVDVLFRHDEATTHPNKSSKQLLYRILRMKGGLGAGNSDHFVPQQQVFFTTATLSQDVKRELELYCRTSTVARMGTEGKMDVRRELTKSKEYSPFGIKNLQNTAAEKGHVAAFVRPFDLDMFAFPPKLLHALVMVRSNTEVALTVHHLLKEYVDSRFAVRGLNLAGMEGQVEKYRFGGNGGGKALFDDEDVREGGESGDGDAGYDAWLAEVERKSFERGKYVMKAAPPPGENVQEKEVVPDVETPSGAPPKALVFVDDDLVGAMHACINDVVGMRCEIFAGSDGRLAAVRRVYDAATAGIVLVIPKSSVRGLDFVNATHVFIAGAPADAATYVHLAGRTARHGQVGLCVTLIPKKHLQLVRDRVRLLKLDFTPTDAASLLVKGGMPVPPRIAANPARGSKARAAFREAGSPDEVMM